MSEKKDDTQFITQSELLERDGWSKANIKKFADPPDKNRPNPHYRKGAPVKLYAFERIIEIEELPEVQQAFAKTKERSARSAKVSEKKRAETIEEAHKFVPTIPEMSEEELIAKAIDHYNDRKSLHPRHGAFFDPATQNSDREFLNRISVNYLRHVGTTYDSELRSYFGKTGVAYTHSIIKNTVLDAIAQSYPYLKNECELQKVTVTQELELQFWG